MILLLIILLHCITVIHCNDSNDTHNNVDLNHYNNIDLDEYAVPSLIIAGVAKGGSTDLWSLLTSVYPHFMCSSSKINTNNTITNTNSSSNSTITKPCILEKEFNLYYVSGGYNKRYSCPSEVLSQLMQCPENIVRNNDLSRNFTRCKEWLDGQYGIISKPKYTIDAYPMLMRDACCEPKLASILKLNDANDQCKITRKKTPKVIILLRDTYNRTLSYYNYFTCRSTTIPLEEMLQLEFDLFSKSPAKEYIDIIAGQQQSEHQRIDYKYAHNIIVAYEKLQLYMEKEMSIIKQNYTNINLERYGLLLDSMYLPQLLSLIFPTNENNERVSIDWPILIIKSEHFFNDRASILEESIIPFMHPNEQIRKATKMPPKEQYMKGAGANYLNSKQGLYSNMSSLSTEMSNKLLKFYSILNINLNNIMFRLSKKGRITLSPQINHITKGWWHQSY